mgnify:CR=1 FL=1
MTLTTLVFALVFALLILATLALATVAILGTRQSTSDWLDEWTESWRD